MFLKFSKCIMRGFPVRVHTHYLNYQSRPSRAQRLDGVGSSFSAVPSNPSLHGQTEKALAAQLPRNFETTNLREICTVRMPASSCIMLAYEAPHPDLASTRTEQGQRFPHGNVRVSMSPVIEILSKCQVNILSSTILEDSHKLQALNSVFIVMVYQLLGTDMYLR